jgi:hypothetical protein
VRAEDQSLAPVAHLDEGLLQQPHVDRVEPGERLVHDQHGGVVEDRGDELDLLLVALRQLLDLALEVVGDPEALEPIDDLGLRLLGRHAVEGRKEAKLLSDLHLGVQPAFLGQVAPRAARQHGVLGPHPGDAAGIGAKDVEHDPHCCRLARAVGAEQPEDPARLDAESSRRRARRPRRTAC